MVLPIWTPDALQSEPSAFERILWRCVEAQHIVATAALVDTLGEQRLLEDILEETKPPVPPECAPLHDLYMTPFRYGCYPNGSRFRRAGPTPGVFYASEAPTTAIIETAFHLLLFYADSPDTPFPAQPTEQTAFDVPVKTQAAINLTAPPFDAAGALWMHTTDYAACQALETAAREQAVEIIRYASVRDPDHNANAAVLTCQAFAARAPTSSQSWRLWFNKAGVHALWALPNQTLSLPPEVWAHDARLDDFHWRRSS
ncbi:MAG: RES family NAD+ phosphorylase [Maricaulaceae bacterium]